MLLTEMSDEDLIFLINRGSKLAENVFYERYSVYSRHQARKYLAEFKDSGISEDEFYAVAFSKTHESLLKYSGVEKVFYVYWKTVVKNAIYDYAKENSYKSGMRMLGGLSYDDYRYKDQIGLLLSDMVGEKERENELFDILKPYLDNDNDLFSGEERIVAKLRIIEEYSLKEIAELTNIKTHRINYLIASARKKLQKLLKENYL